MNLHRRLSARARCRNGQVEADRPGGKDRSENGLSMSKLSTVCRCCVADGIPRRSLAVALVVGAILNLINQGDSILGRGDVDLTKAILTFLVPYGVATYGAVAYRLREPR